MLTGLVKNGSLDLSLPTSKTDDVPCRTLVSQISITAGGSPHKQVRADPIVQILTSQTSSTRFPAFHPLPAVCPVT